MTDSGLLLGLDFGGTKLAAGIVDADAGRLVAVRRQPTPAGGARASFDAMLTMGRALIAEAPWKVVGVGVNFGGPVDAARGVVLRSHHVSGWDGAPLAADIAAALGRPAALENDANGQALAEWRFGAGRGCGALAYLNIGTGIGGGMVLGGRLWRGAHGMAGEFGHIVVCPGGAPCPCGRSGCLEAMAAGPAMGRRAREALAAAGPTAGAALLQLAGSVEGITGRTLTVAAAGGDQFAISVLDAVFADLARGIVAVLNTVDPDLVVLGGGAAEFSPDVFGRLRAAVCQAALPETAGAVRLAPAALGADAGVYGGAAVFLAR